MLAANRAEAKSHVDVMYGSWMLANLTRCFKYLALIICVTSIYFAWSSVARASSIPVQYSFKRLRFRDLGPAVTGGRVTSVAGIPNNPNVYYVGTAGGGMWKSVDGGNNWKALLLHADSSSIGAISLAPSNPNLVWVGTGEANPRNDVLKGGGVYFSPDGGKDWRFMGLKDVGQISSIIVNPKNPDQVYVCALGNVWNSGTKRGVYISSDEGRHWRRTLYVGDQTGCSSIAMQPGKPNVLIAGMWEVHVRPWASIYAGPNSGIYRSIDGGVTWHKVTAGLPTGPSGRSAIEFAPSEPETVYALVPVKQGLLWVSHDGGNKWHFVSDNHALDVRPFYFSKLAVMPNDPNRIFFLSVKLMESKDGGKTVFYADKGVHPDHHAIWIDPTNGNRIIQGNDGGVALSTNGGITWRDLNYLPIEQVYSIGVGNTKPFFVCGGLQDNWVWCGDSTDLIGHRASNRNWWTVTGGDGQYVVPAPSNPNVIYADAQNGSVVRFNLKDDTSQNISPYMAPFLLGTPVFNQRYRFNWTSPIAVTHNNPNEIYLGANVVFQSKDGGANWKAISPDLTRNDKAKQQPLEKIPTDAISWNRANTYDTIQSISLSSLDSRVIWVGTDDGLVWITRDGGRHWDNVTPKNSPKWARVYQIGVSPFDSGTAYVAFDAHKLGDDHPYVYRSNNYGRTWNKIIDGFANDSPVLVVREDPNLRGFLIAGTMRGLYYSRDSGGHWQKLIGNLPTMPIWDLKFVKSASSLVLGSHGRGIWVLDNLRPLEEFTQKVKERNFYLFSTAPGTLYHPASIGRPILPSYVAPNSQTGVVLSYYINKKSDLSPGLIASKKAGSGWVSFQVRTANGHVIDRYSRTSHIGINESAWDMRYIGPTRVDLSKNPGIKKVSLYGPRVVPGRYIVTITRGGKSYRTTAEVYADPRIKVPQNTYAAITAAGLTVRDELSVLNTSINQLQHVRIVLNKFIKSSSSTESIRTAKFFSLLKRAKSLDHKLVKLEDYAYNPRLQRNVAEDRLKYLTHLHGQLQRLYNITANGLFYSPPSIALRTLMTDERSTLQRYIVNYDKLIMTDVSSYNRTAFALGIPYHLNIHELKLPPEIHASDIQN